MKELYFTSPYRRSLRTIRLEYGQVKKKFVLRTFEGNINRRRVSEGSPREEVFEDEQELLKKVHKTKKGLLEGRWIVENKQSFTQPSFLKTEIVDGKISFEFSVDIDPEKLDEQKKKIEENFVQNLGKEIELIFGREIEKKRNCNLISSEE